MYSFLVSSFCIGQFFGSPILGAWSDRLGRKKVLIFTLLLACLGYILGALSLVLSSVTGLLISRILAGIAAGNYAIAQSYIADESLGASKTKNFGLLGMSWGCGFVIGPYLGGVFATQGFREQFGFSLPFMIASVLCILNLVLAIYCLQHSSFVPKRQEISLVRGFKDVRKAFSHPKLKSLFTVMFVFCFGWGFFTEFCPIFLMHRLNYSVAEIGNFFAFFGLWIALGQGLVIRLLSKWFAPTTLLSSSLFIFGFALVAVAFIKTSFQMLVLLPILAIVESMIFPSAATLISNLSSKETQGETLGIYNSVQWAAIGITPFFAGSLIMDFPLIPIIISSLSMFLGFSVFMWFWKIRKENFTNDLTS